MQSWTATAISCPNIAFIKYWGNRDEALHIPSNGSISMNLEGLFTRTQVAFTPALQSDQLTLNQQNIHGSPLERVSAILELVREMAAIKLFASVKSHNNFPTGAGIASSAAAFAALALAASRAAGLELDEQGLSRLARLGSGSACRSVPGGFVEWQAGDDNLSSFAQSIAPAGYWDLVDCVAVISQAHKPTSSLEGHALAGTSPLQAARLADTSRRLEICRQAILERDFAALAEIIELDSNLMHSVMMTSQPALFYWQPVTLEIMAQVAAWRRNGLPACYTVDAGPNVHVLCLGDHASQVKNRLLQIPGVKSVLTARTGGPARLIP
ncbi:MAG: diphosphomevalonate decarboxylase [Anaerolineales bacterium]|nr:diphosphomevalonate decarboxylase [Anaerolineales bacterium]